jgi:hypothetical protein
MGVLNDYARYLPMLKDSPKAVPMTKNGNIPFGKADLAAIMLVSVQMTWQNQYNLTHLRVPKSTSAMLPDLEAIKRVMVEKQNEKLKAKSKATSACPDTKNSPKRKASGARVIKSQRRFTARKKFFPLRPLPDPKHLGVPSLR